jgi:hypothetical protein
MALDTSFGGDGRIWTLAGTLLLGAISCILVVVIKLKFLYVMMTGDPG